MQSMAMNGIKQILINQTNKKKFIHFCNFFYRGLIRNPFPVSIFKEKCNFLFKFEQNGYYIFFEK